MKWLKMSLVAVLILVVSTLVVQAQDTANDNKIRQAYKLMLSRTPKAGKEGGPF